MPTIRLLQITDPHLLGDPTRKLYGVDTGESLRLTLAAALASAPPPDAVLATGDIGDDVSVAAYNRFREALQACGAPVLCIPGNHDDLVLMAAVLKGQGFLFCGRARYGA